MAAATVEQVLQALHAFFFPDGDDAKLKEASRWLEDFQKTSAAWTIADQLIRSETVGPEPRIFAAQTFRQKVMYDLIDLDASSRMSLRDSLVNLLPQFSSGPKSIKTQLCLALADLAIQTSSWEDPVNQMIVLLGKDPKTVGILLEFLRILPEETNGNQRIPIDKTDLEARADQILRKNSQQVLQMIITYLVAPGVTTEIQIDCFDVLWSWLRFGDIQVALLAETPIINMCFDALKSDDLFEVAVDCSTEIIRQAGQQKNATIINMIYPRLLPLQGFLRESLDDGEIVRGICRIFTEAGESFVDLVLDNFEAFQGIVEGLLQCANYDDLDIVKITFNFWFMVADGLESRPEKAPLFLNVYRQLIDIIIKHLRYPEDMSSVTGEEKDQFRDFRHYMGDVLKDCVSVVGQEEALGRACLKIQETLSTPANLVKWQDVEAPLFSLRAMGRKISNDESRVLPQIMGLLQNLPDHPKIQYAAILVIGRYAGWTRMHPEYINYQISFISKGFENPADEDTTAAAALAMKYLCEECGPLLVNFLPQLHPFYVKVIDVLHREDRRELTEAIAYIVNSVPIEEMLKALQAFCLPLAQQLHEIAIKGKPADHQHEVDAVNKAIEILDQVAIFIKCVRPKTIPTGTNPPNVQFIHDMWPIFELLLSNFADSTLGDAIARCFRYSIESCRGGLTSLLPQMLAKINAAFEQTGRPCYLWSVLQFVKEYASDTTDNGKLVFSAVEHMTGLMLRLIQSTKQQDMNPDAIQDFFILITRTLERSPVLATQSAIQPAIFQCGLSFLSMEEPDCLQKVLAYFYELFKASTSSSPIVVERIQQIGREQGLPLVGMLFEGLFFHFPRERFIVAEIGPILKFIYQMMPEQTVAFISNLIGQLPDPQLSLQDRQAFVKKVEIALGERDPRKLSSVLNDFSAQYRRRNLVHNRASQRTESV
ncbi:armadillo-type protein [Polychytrium aggregatum]|uniref:armadillo-type protein n=1 Tax=Polychytrium aggregatum TaxID=110093 RepID=UPI0022FDFFF6|nr:armadillo-type protein [Polychytrium aggregatum]KAI9208648.1 armadillo-type protein [Polychytrium aggregatum]